MSVVDDDFELIGGREERPVVIVDYDAGWPDRFAAERDRIANALGASVIAIHHIGSTSVPGLAAKPIIDVLVEVADPADEGTFVPQLAVVGYELRVRESGHRCLRTAQRDVHAHIWVDSADTERHLLFRDRLRASASDRAQYEARKRQLAREQWGDMNDYAQAKNAVVAEIYERALAWDADGRPPVS